MVHRRHELRAAKSLQEELFACENVEMVWDSVSLALTGEESVTGLTVKNVKTGEERTLPVSGVFVAVGILPNSGLAEGIAACDGGGYVIAGEDGATSAPGFFAARDVRTKMLRQLVTAVSDGANCVASAERFLSGQK